MSRDRDARLAATITRGSGFDQPAAVLVVRQLAPVTALLARDDATVRRVLDDTSTRRSLVEGVRQGFQEGWRRATLERLRRDHDDWLRAWWAPACTDAELDRLRAAPSLRPAHHRVGWPLTAAPVTSGAAQLLLADTARRELAGYLLVERRLADAVRRLADEFADELAGGSAAAGASRSVAADVDTPPAGVDPDGVTDVGWWHLGSHA